MGNIFSESNEDDEPIILDENEQPTKKIKQNKNNTEESFNFESSSKVKTRRKRNNLKNKSKANRKQNYY
jgi:hypothetical protein